ncbi:MAG: purine-nucleoside phosphorylase [Clostridia bacterium]|nr:purine-nucleoside phosphorylase [Clostridia bacterium]
MDKSRYYTPHIKAAPGDFAKTVLMPGDPKRAEFIAKNFLENAVLVNDVRGIKGFTGEYKGKQVSVMASGMGMPSIGIYSYELFNFFGVENIIRVGSSGSLQESVKVRDIIIGMGASTPSSYGEQFGLTGSFAPIASWELLSSAVEESKRLGARYHVGNLLSSDVFYNADPDFNKKWAQMGILGVEMEAAALYMNAARAGKGALAICTVSDEIFTGIATTADERESSFAEMIEIALNVAAKQ